MTDIAIVNEQDEIVGSASREVALRDGLIHRIAQILVINNANEILLQRRGKSVDAPGKWDHSVAGHVDAGENYVQAALREAHEEMGFTNLQLTPLTKLFREGTKNDNIFRRFHLVFIASTDETPRPALGEIAEIRWLSLVALNNWITSRSEDFTASMVETQPALAKYFATISGSQC